MKKILHSWYEGLIRTSLTQRFAIAAALMAIVVLIVTGVTSWWLSNLELEQSTTEKRSRSRCSSGVFYYGRNCPSYE